MKFLCILIVLTVQGLAQERIAQKAGILISQVRATKGVAESLTTAQLDKILQEKVRLANEKTIDAKALFSTDFWPEGIYSLRSTMVSMANGETGELRKEMNDRLAWLALCDEIIARTMAEVYPEESTIFWKPELLNTITSQSEREDVLSKQISLDQTNLELQSFWNPYGIDAFSGSNLYAAQCTQAMTTGKPRVNPAASTVRLPAPELVRH